MRQIGQFCLILLVEAAVAVGSASASSEWCNPPTLTPKQISLNRGHAKEAAEYAIYAILSNNAYDESKEKIPLPPDWYRKDYKYVGGETGLALTVFEKRSNGKPTEVVVAFRGTDNRPDWKTNVEPFRRTQMKPAEENFEAIIKQYKDENVRFVITGHSLGGGLALHISFHYPGVDAIVFDASPVARPGLVPRPATRVSIWESGEVLEAPRDTVRAKWPKVIRIKYRFVHGPAIHQHRILPLAASLIKLGAAESPMLADFLMHECSNASIPNQH